MFLVKITDVGRNVDVSRQLLVVKKEIVFEHKIDIAFMPLNCINFLSI